MKLDMINFLSFGAKMSTFTYIPVFAQNLGISNIEIGLIAAASSLSLFFSSFLFGRASDRIGRKFFLLAGLSLSTVSLFMLIFAEDFYSLLILDVIVGFCLGIFPASLIAFVHESKRDLSKFSSFGALGWTFGVLTAGSIAIYFGVSGVFVFSALLLLLAFLTVTSINFPKHHAIDVPRFPVQVIRKNIFL